MNAATDQHQDTITAIVKAVCNTYIALEESMLFDKDQTETVTIARQICFYLIREFTGLSYEKIGAMFGISRFSVQNGCSNIYKWQANKDFKNRIHGIKAQVKQLLPV